MSGNGVCPLFVDQSEGSRSRLIPLIFYSVSFHLLVFLIIPLATKLLWKQETYSRPRTFQLVSAPAPPAPRAPAEPKPAAPSRSEPKPQPKPTPKPAAAQIPAPVGPKPAPQPEESLDELASLLETLPVPARAVAYSEGVKKFPWYLTNVEQKIQRFWNPATRDPSLSVVVEFTILSNGTMSGLSVAGGSGNATLDNLALRAVELAKPFGKFPPGLTERFIRIRLTLKPVEK